MQVRSMLSCVKDSEQHSSSSSEFPSARYFFEPSAGLLRQSDIVPRVMVENMA